MVTSARQENLPLLAFEGVERRRKSRRSDPHTIYLAIHAVVAEQTLIVQFIERERKDALEHIPRVVTQQTGQFIGRHRFT